jgi:cyclin T
LLLHTLGFDFNVEHPYKHLLNVAKRINQAQNVKESDSRSLAQVAWNFANDRLQVFFTILLAHIYIAWSPMPLPFPIYFSETVSVLSVCERRCACSLLPKT